MPVFFIRISASTNHSARLGRIRCGFACSDWLERGRGGCGLDWQRCLGRCTALGCRCDAAARRRCTLKHSSSLQGSWTSASEAAVATAADGILRAPAPCTMPGMMGMMHGAGAQIWSEEMGPGPVYSTPPHVGNTGGTLPAASNQRVSRYAVHVAD